MFCISFTCGASGYSLKSIISVKLEKSLKRSMYKNQFWHKSTDKIYNIRYVVLPHVFDFGLWFSVRSTLASFIGTGNFQWICQWEINIWAIFKSFFFDFDLALCVLELNGVKCWLDGFIMFTCDQNISSMATTDFNDNLYYFVIMIKMWF